MWLNWAVLSTIVCFGTEKYFPLVIKLTLDRFKGCLPLWHCRRMQWFVVSQRRPVNMEHKGPDNSVLAEHTWSGPTPHTQCIFLNEEASNLSCMWGICRECLGSAVGAQMRHMIYVLQGHPAYPRAIEASNTEQALAKSPCFQETTGSAGLCDTGTGGWTAEDLPKTHCKRICVAKILRAVRYIWRKVQLWKCRKRCFIIHSTPGQTGKYFSPFFFFPHNFLTEIFALKSQVQQNLWETKCHGAPITCMSWG